MKLFLLVVFVALASASPLVDVPKPTQDGPKPIQDVPKPTQDAPKSIKDAPKPAENDLKPAPKPLGANGTIVRDIFDCPHEYEAVHLLHSQVYTFSNPSSYESLKKIVYIPDSGVLRAPITCITVRDQNAVGQQGTAIEVAGGIGEYYLELLLTSARGHHIKVKVELFSLL